MGNVTKVFGERLKTLREAAELTQQQLAEALKVSRGAISYYENGDRTPDIEFLDCASEYFGVSFDYLLGFSENLRCEYANMYEIYGLTDQACYELEIGNAGPIISEILTDKDFFIVERMLSDMIKYYKDFDSTMIDYFSFLLSNFLTKTIKKSLLRELNAQYTPNDLEEICKNIEQFRNDFEEIRKLKEIEETAKEEERKKRKEEIMNSPDVMRRRKVYEKLSFATSLLDED